MFSCNLKDGFYEIKFSANLSPIKEEEVLFEDKLLLIKKSNLLSYIALADNHDEDYEFLIRISVKDFNSKISYLKNKSKTRDYIINRFTHNELIAPLFKKTFFPENFKIKSYQEDGISWLMENNGRLLADDMGLGKTAQSLVAATNLIRSTEIKRVLIVCPRSLMQNWADEIQIWAQSFKCYVVSSEANSEKLWKGIIKHGHFFIINYDQMRKIPKSIIENPPDLIICDEAHKLRKKTSMIHKGLKKLSPMSQRFWALTGTPIEKIRTI